MFWATINFVLFVALLVYALRAPVKDFFRSRTDRLTEALAAGAEARQEAEAARAELDRELRDLPALRARLRADLMSAAEAEKARLLRTAREAVERILADARLVAEQQASVGREELRAEVIDEAVREATAMLRDLLKPEDQQRLVRDFLERARAA
jgi:F-type H+-transporting ATPase subunit b